MNYAVIIPVYNEELYLAAALDSLMAQSLLPSQVIIVNDGSTDGTPAIIAQYSQQYSQLKVVHKQEKKTYRIGGTVVENFQLGYAALQPDFEFVVKLDADITLPVHYFATIAQHFSSRPKLGLAGGKQLMLKNKEWVYEPIGDPDHVKGPCKSYRKACLESMKGLRPTIGWDSADEMLAQFYGWEVLVDDQLLIHHHRLTGTNTGQFAVRRRIGHGFYRIRYGFFVSAFSALKSALRTPPYLVSGIAIFLGYLEAWIRRDTFAVTEEEGQYIRQFRWQRMLKKLKN
ncbi:MAG: glycosyl transferase family 2 [Bacteroidetes bacterium]|nr:MAG: glycosyl transferase family 2 [Bacteroidota bacterium]PTM14331.1 MAG: glycosyl transferase family 2 [Bacteroidota bacterium]